MIELENALARANEIIGTNEQQQSARQPGRGCEGYNISGRSSNAKLKAASNPYCFHHGYAYKDKEGYWGATCKYMIENEYEEHFLNVRSPCTIDGFVD